MFTGPIELDILATVEVFMVVNLCNICMILFLLPTLKLGIIRKGNRFHGKPGEPLYVRPFRWYGKSVPVQGGIGTSKDKKSVTITTLYKAA